ncbi:hypothetical protein ACHQM5_024148 [Ranunculus cassubicifolius]
MKRKDISKLSQSSQEAETKEILSKEDQAQSTVNLATKKIKNSSSPSQDNASTVNPHSTSVFQWPYPTVQPIQKQSPISLTSRPSLPTQQPQIVVSNQWFPSSINQPQHNSHPFTRTGTADTNWQNPMGASSRTEHQIPGMYYQGGQSHPVGIPGAWNPSPWWGPAQQSHHPSTYSFPGAYGYYPIPPPPSAVSDSSQRGFIRIEESLSRKHQKMWEAQSLENIQLWAAIGQLRADLAVYGSRVMKLEAEVSSLKSTTELPTGPCTGNFSDIAQVRQTVKRGRPRKVAPTNDEYQPQSRVRKPTSKKSLPETIVPEAETSKTQQENNGKISNGVLSGQKMPQTIPATSTLFSGLQGKDVNNGWGASNNGFYNSVHVIRQEGKVIPGWSFMNKNATQEHEDMVMNSGKDDNEEELEDASSGADDTNRTKFWLN